MSFEVETPTETQARVRLRVPADAIEAALNEEVGELRTRARVPGFRPGKVPKQLLQKRLGDSLVKDVRRRLVNDEFKQAVVERKLHPVDAPQLDDEKLLPKEDGTIAVELELDVIPHVEPTGYDRFDVTPPPMQIGEADVARELEGLRRQLATVDVVADGVAAAGDVVVADLSLSFLDGTKLENRLENRVVDTGAGLVDGLPCEEAKTKFVGCRRGDAVRVSLKLPDDFPDESRRGMTAVTDCEVKDVRRYALADLASPQLHEKLGVKSEPELRERVTERLRQFQKAQQDHAVEELCLDQLLERNRVVLPPAFVQRHLEGERERVRRDLAARGAQPAAIEQQLLEHEGRMRSDVERHLRVQFLLDRLAEKFETAVSVEELEQQFVQMARASQADPQKLFDWFQQQGMVPRVVEDVRRAKVRRQLREAATPVEDGAPTLGTQEPGEST
jgi:trigger factor